MLFQIMPLQAIGMEFSRWQTTQDPSKLIADAQDRYDGNGGIDPGTGYARQFVQAEDEGGGYGHRGMEAKKRGEADKDSDGEAKGDMAWMTIQRKYGLQFLL